MLSVSEGPFTQGFGIREVNDKAISVRRPASLVRWLVRGLVTAAWIGS
jgi:hypothetical protein